MAQKSLQSGRSAEETQQLDEIFELHDDKSEFSGFSEVEEDEIQVRPKSVVHTVSKVTEKSDGTSQGPQKKKAKVSKKQPSGAPSGNKKRQSSDMSSDGSKAKKSSDKPFTLDVSKLSSADLESLREALGFSGGEHFYDEDDLHYQSQPQYEKMTIQIDSNDISDSEPQNDQSKQTLNFGNALFGDDNESSAAFDDSNEWELPRLKAPDLGDPVNKSLADLINTACSQQCETECITSKYKVPANCDLATPPLVNQLIWKSMDRNAHKNDRTLVDIQNLVAVGFAPVIQLAEAMKGKLDNKSKSLMSDIMTLLGQIQFQLSVRRRYLIRPTLKKKYQSLVNVTTPVTKNLFGDNVERDIKTCDNTPVVREYGRGGFAPFRGRGTRPMRRPYNHGGYSRYNPYQRGGFQSRGFRPRRRGAATATSPNDQD